MNALTTAIELVGIGLVVAGVALLSVPAALIVAGAGLLWISRSVTR